VIDILVKASVVLFLALLVTACARSGSAAFRHRIWTLAISAALLLPALQVLLPEWRGMPVPAFASALASHSTPSNFPIPRAPSLAVNAGSPAPASYLGAWLLTTWLTGFLVVCSRVAKGFVGLSTLVRRSRPADGPCQRAFAEVCANDMSITRRVKLRILAEPAAMPCTSGLCRPVIFFPADCVQWPASRLRVVLLHELAHIRRCDWATGLLSQLFLAVYWFHPLAWMAWRKQKEESERACDDAVLLAGHDAPTYADELLQLVKSTCRTAHLPESALAVAGRSHLERRVNAMLDNSLNRHRVSRVATLFTTTLALLILVPLAALHSTAQSKSGGLAGSVTDPRGASIASATVILSNVQARTRDMTATDAAGAFHFHALPPGDYELRVLKPGFREHRTLTMLDSSQPNFQNIALEMGAISEQVKVTETSGSAANSSVGAAPTRLTIGGSVQAAALVNKVTPIYPAAAKANRAQGAVVLEATIGPDGVPSSLQVVNRQIDADLARAAVEAVSQWRYRPTLLNGQPIAVQTDVTVNFTLIP